MSYKISNDCMQVEADTYDECVKLWELLRGVTPVADSDGWIEHDGGEMPIPGDTLIQTIEADETKDNFVRKVLPASDFGVQWNDSTHPYRITHYRVVK